MRVLLGHERVYVRILERGRRPVSARPPCGRREVRPDGREIGNPSGRRRAQPGRAPLVPQARPHPPPDVKRRETGDLVAKTLLDSGSGSSSRADVQGAALDRVDVESVVLDLRLLKDKDRLAGMAPPSHVRRAEVTIDDTEDVGYQVGSGRGNRAANTGGSARDVKGDVGA
jgi:hypothetical protein